MEKQKGMRPEMKEFLFDEYCTVVTGTDYSHRAGGSYRRVIDPFVREDLNNLNKGDVNRVVFGLGSGVWLEGDELPKK